MPGQSKLANGLKAVKKEPSDLVKASCPWNFHAGLHFFGFWYLVSGIWCRMFLQEGATSKITTITIIRSFV